MTTSYPRIYCREFLKKLYDEQVLNHPENHVPTQITMFLEDAIRALPYAAVDGEDMVALFRDALEHATGREL